MTVKLTWLMGECEKGQCPTLYATDRGTLAVQGVRMVDHGLDLSAHETMAEVPIELVRKAIRDNLI